jgi:hypothetical protein
MAMQLFRGSNVCGWLGQTKHNMGEPGLALVPPDKPANAMHVIDFEPTVYLQYL